MLSKEEIEKAKEIMKHWVEYEKQNKGKINKADELIEIQETLLQHIKQLEQENNKKSKIIDEMLDEYEYNARCNLKNFCDEEMRKNKCIQDCRICIKQYFEKKVEEE